MSISYLENSTLTHVWGGNTLVRKFVIALVGSVLIGLSSKIQVPFYPVPMTMQTLVILLVGLTMGWRWGALTILFHLLQGAGGLPVFAGTPEKGLGLIYMVGPTGGYLMGFLLAVIAVGWLAEKGWDRHPLLTCMAMVIGNIIIYTCGVAWLGVLLGWDKPLLEWGVYPFLLGDLLKVMIAAFLVPFMWKLNRAVKQGDK